MEMLPQKQVENIENFSIWNIFERINFENSSNMEIVHIKIKIIKIASNYKIILQGFEKVNIWNTLLSNFNYSNFNLPSNIVCDEKNDIFNL